MAASKSRSGISGVVAALAILFLALITMITVTLAMSRMAGFSIGSLREGLERRGESVAIYLYNVSLCGLLKGTLSPREWRLVIVNTGPVEIEVDSLVVEKMGALVLSRKNIRLDPGGYERIIIGHGDYHDARVYVHTTRGSLFVGGYEIPDPYMLVEVDAEKRCMEP